MKIAVVLIAGIIASVHSGSVRYGRQGWGNPTTTPGWGPAPVDTNIDLNAALAAAGSGWAAENHADNVQVIGGGGWEGPNAQLVISSSGDSIIGGQDISIIQVTSQDAESAASLNNVDLSLVAQASEGQVLDALGLDITNQQSGWAGASGEAASAADATSAINVNTANLGAAKP